MIWMIAPKNPWHQSYTSKTVTLELGEEPEGRTSQKPPQRYLMGRKENMNPNTNKNNYTTMKVCAWNHTTDKKNLT